ncbi:MAG TPA: DeoR/GlpR family DNA-binding transcription regulator [Propionibacteriaceae bacterium]|nr:DeoR/GlpR family DNA-binding transcription regulator [Propionibacteriaceae bacterium]
MYAAERQQRIVELAREAGRVDVLSLADVFNVTAETVRRDLTALEGRGAVRRVHGGALPVERLAMEPTLTDRQSKASAEKRRIAARALDELPDDGTILLDSGTTTWAIAQLLPIDSALTVVTNSIAIAATLEARPNLDLYLLGGRVRRRTGAAVGEWIDQALADVRVDVAFLGTNGFSQDRGFSTPDQVEAAAKKAMLRSARRAIVVTDSSKAGQEHFHRFARLDEVAMLITDAGLDDETADQLDSAGLDVARA